MSRDLVPRQTKSPVPTFELRMPDGTPFGIGFLGAARFWAIRRVMERADQAYRAAAGLIDARSEVNSALVRHAATVEQLNNLDVLREQVATRIIEGAEIERLRLQLERMELEDQIAQRELARRKARGISDIASPATSAAASRDEMGAFIGDLRRMPDIAKAAAGVKAEIIQDAGGEGNLSEAGRQMIEAIDVMLTAFVQKQAEGRLV